ncbi:Fur family transcriptional regulator [Actinotalea subterranea]|uniref:Fur family transcriptional regulator n=1 Tax=Actinotalea subterranea TaxID=2607497 RepID=UPI0011EFDEDB
MRVDLAPARESRQTVQSRALLTFLAQADRCLTAQEIHAQLHRQGSGIALATVYRWLTRLVRSGAVDVLMHDDGEATYVRGSDRHHHHLVCRSCGRVTEISEPMVERWTVEVATRAGFADVSHALTVFGTCSACRGSGPS